MELPVDVTLTLPALAPAPPNPPMPATMLRSVLPPEFLESAQLNWPLTLSAPLPPPPATLCAKMPCVQPPTVVTVPVCVALTSPLAAPVPPKPPMPNVTDGTFFSLLNEMPPLTLRPPLPPPPPRLCAIRPAPLDTFDP